MKKLRWTFISSVAIFFALVCMMTAILDHFFGSGGSWGLIFLIIAVILFAIGIFLAARD